MEKIENTINRLIDRLVVTGKARLLPPNGFPAVSEKHQINDELHLFYERCGGMYLYEDQDFPITILGPSEIRLANLEMFAGISEAEIEKSRGDRSWNWYILAECDSDPEEKVVMDLGSDQGWCYDCHWSRYPGNSVMIARGLTEFLHKLLEYDGSYLYWREK